MNQAQSALQGAMDALTAFLASYAPAAAWYTAVVRFLFPILAVLILFRAIRALLRIPHTPETWGQLSLPNGASIPLTHWENIIGRHPKSDLVIDLPTISKNHAVLTRYDDGSWTITDTESTGGVRINGEEMDICALEPGDEIELGGL